MRIAIVLMLFATFAVQAASYSGPIPQGPKWKQLRAYLEGRAATPGRIPQGPKWGALRAHIDQLEREKAARAAAEQQARAEQLRQQQEQQRIAEERQRLEQECFNMVQNRVAWNQAGNRSWNPTNVRKLCNNTRDPRTTVSCFRNAIAAHDDWNRATSQCSARG